MVALTVIVLIVTVWWLAYQYLPKGNLFYDGIHLLSWIYRLESAPKKNLRKAKHRYGSNFRQYILHYRPSDGTEERNHVIIYFHGGGWQFGRPEMFRGNANTLTQLGYHVFMPSHRRIPFFDIKDLRTDALKAVLKVREVMQSEGISNKKIILGGVSSGGNLAALLAFDRTLLGSQELFAGLFLLASPLDLNYMWDSPPLLMLAGRRTGNRFRMANPAEHLQHGEQIPTLILHGDMDGIVEYANSVSFFEKMKTLEARAVRMETITGGIHQDAASWCFEGHPSRRIVLGWLEEHEKQKENPCLGSLQ